MFYSLVLKLKNYPKEINSYFLYSAFLKEIDRYFEERLEKYHQKNQKKPSTISPVYQINNQFFLRFTFLTDEIFNIGFYIFSHIDYFKIKNKKLEIENVLIKKSKNLPALVNKMIDNLDYQKSQLVKDKKVVLDFKTPTLIRQGKNYINYFDKQSFDGSFLKKQKEIFGKELLSCPKYKIIYIKILTKKYDLPPFNQFFGFVGQVKINLQEGDLNYFKALSFFGVGIKTTMGMEQVLVDF